ncbi:MAG: hypothetical protein WC275_02840 [Bacilli bacterium]
MNIKHLLFITLNAFILFVAFYILTRSLFTLLFFLSPLLYLVIKMRKRHV